MRRKIPDLVGIGYNLPDHGGPVRHDVGDIYFHVCCDCKLRHIVSIERSPYSPKEIVERWWRDDRATEALRVAESITIKKAKRRAKR